MTRHEPDPFAVLTGRAYTPGTMVTIRRDAPLVPAGTAVEPVVPPSFEPTADLKRFVVTSLADGSGRAQVFRALLEQGFDMETCAKAMDGFMPKLKMAPVHDASLRSPGPTPLSLYFAFANVDLTRQSNATRIRDPRLQLYEWREFLGAAECNRIISALERYFSPSALPGNDQNGSAAFGSSNTALMNLVDPALDQEITERIASGIGLDPRYAEGVQVHRQGPTNEQAPDRRQTGPNASANAGPTGLRTWGCLIYLNDEFKGGETCFEPGPATVSPESGKAVFWNNLSPLGQINPSASPVDQPVVHGTRFVLTAWFRENP